MKKLFVVIFILLAMASWASADIYVKSKAHTDAISMMGQNRPAQDTFSEQWIGDDQFANITENLTTIIDLKKNIFDMINHKDKTYVETTLPLDMSKLLPPEMSAMAGMMKASITVNPHRPDQNDREVELLRVRCHDDDHDDAGQNESLGDDRCAV